MVAQHYRWDFIGLSTDEKPTPATSEKVVDGSTFYEADTSKLYVFCKTQWYEKESTGGGGGGGESPVKILTSEDYNFPENSPELIAFWLLPVGQYVLTPHTKYMESGSSATNNRSNEVGVLVLTQGNNTNYTYSTFIVSDNFKNEYYKVQYDGTLNSGFPHEI